MIGVYIIRHPTSGVFYIGSTGSYSKRQKNHLHALRQNSHHNAALQQAYSINPNITWEFHPTTTRDEAYALERSMIKSNVIDPAMANLKHAVEMTAEHRAIHAEVRLGTKHHPDTLAKMSRTRSGSPKNPEWSDKIAESRRMGIEVNGVAYRSATEAATAHGITLTGALHRARNPNPKFAHWKFINA